MKNGSNVTGIPKAVNNGRELMAGGYRCKTDETPTAEGAGRVSVERTTVFETATLTLARSKAPFIRCREALQTGVSSHSLADG